MKRILCIGLVATLLTGCASFKASEPYPATAQKAAPKTTTESLSRMSDAALGTYQVADQPIFITGHQKGQTAGMMFGLIGVMVADQINKSNGETQFSSAVAKAKQVDVSDIAMKAIQATLRDNNAQHLDSSAQGSDLVIQPHAILTVAKDSDKAVLHMVLKARLKEGNNELWWTRVFGEADGSYPIVGDDGWFASPEKFRLAIEQASRRAALGLVRLTDHNLPEPGNKIKVKTLLPWLATQTDEVIVEVIEKTPENAIFRVRAGDVFLPTGLYVVPSGALQLSASAQ
jgi:PBP1b-binding outer membrane lipoprotein LpoB